MIDNFEGIVKRQLDYWKYQVETYGPDHPRHRHQKYAKYQHLIREFSELADFLAGLREAHGGAAATPAPSEFQTQVAAPRRPPAVVEPPARRPPPDMGNDLPDDLAGLPPELLKELSENIKGETDPLIKIINARGGTATLDEILIDLYRKYNEIGKRNIISNRLYRLAKRGHVSALSGKKGLYTTAQVVDPAQITNETSPEENDKGSNAETSEPSSGKSETTPSSSKSSVVRRELFASTAIPPYRNPR
ncbi:MAG: hypothetical protein E7813_06045 [Bradyrhizobium sp.]|uniref:hypothetical protein n=1 Tax=Bradyrhizobium sp. TaxID=376 RepID=UPI0012243D12|nr:hypothetical protein [Bradyrhizobium sp.]THD71240.1 MAG: hypothetical protein E7813_06045 [Bradyrhizobium sp.]